MLTPPGCFSCLQINPETFSTGMFSWFPLFFPLRECTEPPLHHPSQQPSIDLS